MSEGGGERIYAEDLFSLVAQAKTQDPAQWQGQDVLYLDASIFDFFLRQLRNAGFSRLALPYSPNFDPDYILPDVKVASGSSFACRDGVVAFYCKQSSEGPFFSLKPGFLRAFDIVQDSLSGCTRQYYFTPDPDQCVIRLSSDSADGLSGMLVFAPRNLVSRGWSLGPSSSAIAKPAIVFPKLADPH